MCLVSSTSAILLKSCWSWEKRLCMSPEHLSNKWWDFDWQMADELFDLLDNRSYVERSRTVKPNKDNTFDFSFLEQIITPVHQVVAAVSSSWFFVNLGVATKVIISAPYHEQVEDCHVVWIRHSQLTFRWICRKQRIIWWVKLHIQHGEIMMISMSSSGTCHYPTGLSSLKFCS